jgi:hypothetical protein
MFEWSNPHTNAKILQSPVTLINSITSPTPTDDFIKSTLHGVGREVIFLEEYYHCSKTVFFKNTDVSCGTKITSNRCLTQEIFIELQRLKDKIRSLTDVAAAYTLEINRLLDGTSSNIDSIAENFSFKCPNDKCKGFLNSKHFCNLCDTPYCKDCMCIFYKKRHRICNRCFLLILFQ